MKRRLKSGKGRGRGRTKSRRLSKAQLQRQQHWSELDEAVNSFPVNQKLACKAVRGLKSKQVEGRLFLRLVKCPSPPEVYVRDFLEDFCHRLMTHLTEVGHRGGRKSSPLLDLSPPKVPPVTMKRWLSSSAVQTAAGRCGQRLKTTVTAKDLYWVVGMVSSTIKKCPHGARRAVLESEPRVAYRLGCAAEKAQRRAKKPQATLWEQLPLPLEAPSEVLIDWTAAWQDKDGDDHTIEVRRVLGQPVLQHRRNGEVVTEVTYDVTDSDIHAFIEQKRADAWERQAYAEFLDWLQEHLAQGRG
jgi:hypothetical protein